MSKFRQLALPPLLCVVGGSFATFFVFGIIHSSEPGFLSAILSGLKWILFGFVKKGLVNTYDGHLIEHNLWPYIIPTSAQIFLIRLWRLKTKSA